MLGLRWRVVGKNELVVHNRFEKIPIWADPLKREIHRNPGFTFINLRLFRWTQILRNFMLKLYSLIIRLAQNHVALKCWFVVILCWGPLLNVQSQPGNRRRRPLCVMRSPTIFQIWLYYTSWTMLLTCEVPLYTQLEHSVVMSIWNVDAQQRQIGTESCYIMSVSHKLSYLLVRIMLLSQNMVTIIF